MNRKVMMAYRSIENYVLLGILSLLLPSRPYHGLPQCLAVLHFDLNMAANPVYRLIPLGLQVSVECADQR